VELDRGTLELDVHPQQAVAIDRTRRVFIKCDYFDSAILAEVQNANVRKMTASLRNFTFVEIMAERRDALRLELEPPTETEIGCEAGKFHGKLFDISLGGFSVRTDQHCPLEKEVEVRLSVMVPNLLQNTLSRIETQARHIETIKEGGSYFSRYSFQANAQSEAVISRFVFQRQVEIIREIKEAS
jgi:c-di-GMP-binding flagellar brake protein YcgR